ncbi:MAG: HAMP domain-containing histidine kinase, partial [Anaerolineales bacterium]|nr:HAMP domain-containing histidine kinase [Anaerolineales bacterium]
QEQVETLLAINKSGHHLLSLINDILDLAKIEAGKMELELAPVNLETICLESLQFVRQMAREKQLQIVTRFDSHVNMILADERRLKQILVNLLSNAVKFTPPDGEISLGFKGIAGEQIVEITVTDTGIGISTADQTLLFQSFVQASSGLDRSHEGTGLGLALVYRMVTMHGGSIALDSKVGEGSSFTIR